MQVFSAVCVDASSRHSASLADFTPTSSSSFLGKYDNLTCTRKVDHQPMFTANSSILREALEVSLRIMLERMLCSIGQLSKPCFITLSGG
jgi:hypothetical protein